MAKNNEAAQAANQNPTPEVNPETGAAVPANAPAQEPVKQDKRKKEPGQPSVVPFQLITAENKARLANIGKPNDQTLTLLLDAYERNADPADPQSQNIIAQLQQEIKNLKLQLTETQQSNSTGAAKQTQLEQTVQNLKAEIAAKDQEIAELKQKIADNAGEVAERDQKISELESKLADNGLEDDKEIETKIQQLTARATKAEDEVKDNRKLIDGLNAAKHELEKQLTQAQKERDEAREAYLNADKGEVSLIHNRYPEGDILHFMPDITALLLEETAVRLTAKRKDATVVTPQMILGDMFNRYTVLRQTILFYWPVLDDDDIVEIAQKVDKRLTTIKMVKAALGI